jgi:formamidopyrimidine-DNA glycosylase
VPELPEVETTRRGIQPYVQGRALRQMIVRERRLRWPVPDDLEQILAGRKILALARRGKYLLLKFSHGTALWHLGMSGSLRLVDPRLPADKHDHIDWVFNRDLALRFHDPRRFGALLWTEEPVEEHPLLKHLGPEPLEEHFDGAYLFRKTRKSDQAIKSWLMNARNVVGVGNIYANEALFNSGLRPLKKASTLSAIQCDRLAEAVKQILANAIQRGGTTLRDFVGGDGKPGYFAQELSVYGRGGMPCHQCGKILTEERLGQRSTVYCARCQK